jgi:hypothetical protein
MLKVAALMLKEEVDNAPPEPRGGIERFRPVATQFLMPRLRSSGFIWRPCASPTIAAK